MTTSEAQRLTTWEERIGPMLAGARPGEIAEVQWLVRCFCACSSTMDEARLVLDALGSRSCALLLTAEQYAGRGRQGRTWCAAPGALSVSYVFSSDLPVARLTGFSLAAGLAVSEVLAQFGCRVGLKWPNDIVAAGKKLGGILVETLSRARRTYTITGIGLNIEECPAAFPQSVCVWELCHGQPDAVTLAAAIGRALHRIWQRVLQEGFGVFCAEWNERSILQGRRVSIQSAESVLTGQVMGINQQGALLLDGDHGVTCVHSGHVLEVFS